MTSEKWIVTYRTPELTKDELHYAGPYADELEAREHLRDISGFKGVCDCIVEQARADMGERAKPDSK